MSSSLNDFQEMFDYEHQLIEQERLLEEEQKEQKEQQSLNKSHVKKIIDEDVLYTDDLRDVFPKYYDKSFLSVKKDNSKDFVFFKY
jgi:alpha-D-ribose 1-methylphosphonate 5-triphosphate synthase subunit PhnI